MSTKPDQIYEKIQQKISSILENMKAGNADGELQEAIANAKKNLRILNEEIQVEYDKLQADSEWKRFTIAFYGETNAGKSTLIEALRLLWKEPGKLQQQAQFRAFQQQNGLTQKDMDDARQVVAQTESEIEANRQKLTQLAIDHAAALAHMQAQIQRMTDFAEQMAAQRKWWQKIMAWFSSPPEKAQLADAQAQLQNLETEQAQTKAEMENVLRASQQRKQQAEDRLALIAREMEKLQAFADGRIIGDGRSDFTRDNTSFEFDVNGRAFTLIDMPGIEGDENIVKAPIEQAVRKAHAVFYVTRNPRPPQSHEGETDSKNGGKKGTLEKIKEHLGAQTEVWAIYNHPVTNPRMLKKPLFNEDTQGGLDAMDAKLKEQLKENYAGFFALSARPAYLALTECVVPGSKEEEEKQKFLTRFNREQILEQSGLGGFCERLLASIMTNYKFKIQLSNLKKACKVLEKAIIELGKLIRHFSDGARQVKEQVQNARSQILMQRDRFFNQLTNIQSQEIGKFADSAETLLYEKIEDGIGNDELKELIEHTLQTQAGKFETSLRNAVQSELQAFSEEVKRTIRRSSEHLQDIMQARSEGNDFGNFDISINIDNGINLFGLLSSGIGLVVSAGLLMATPVGWTAAAVTAILGAIGALVALYKAVRGIFDSEYKKAQQRQAADEAVQKARESIEESMQKMDHAIRQQMTLQMGKLQEEIDMPVKQYDAIIDMLRRACADLLAIAKYINRHLNRETT